MAEKCKIAIGSAFPMEREQTMLLRGRNLINGLPESVEVSSVEMREALSDCVQTIVNTVREALDETPPELVATHGFDIAARAARCSAGWPRAWSTDPDEGRGQASLLRGAGRPGLEDLERLAGAGQPAYGSKARGAAQPMNRRRSPGLLAPGPSAWLASRSVDPGAAAVSNAAGRADALQRACLARPPAESVSGNRDIEALEAGPCRGGERAPGTDNLRLTASSARCATCATA
jgi:hypothetical protein